MQNVMQALYLTRNARGLPASARRYNIAEYEGRTKNRELEQMIKRRVAAFEKEFGEIEL